MGQSFYILQRVDCNFFMLIIDLTSFETKNIKILGTRINFGTEIHWQRQLLHVQKNHSIFCVIHVPKATEDFKLKNVSTDIEEVILQYGLILICLSI